MERKTPLYEEHVKLGGKIVPFAGWLLPVQYSGVIAEHNAVRTACGLFDVSHMGEILCTGADALANLNHLLTNDYTDMEIGQARYSPMCNENGGVVDDLIVYKKTDERYLIVVNAANRDKDFSWMLAHQIGDVELTDISDEVAQLALQGPKAEAILRKLAAPDDIPEKYYTCKFDREIAGVKCIVSRTGYTGEDGFELYMAARDAVKLWNLLLEAGKDEGLLPCGLGARDTLRLEAAMPLYGHEMNDEISPREAGLGIFVKMQKDDFIGKAALEAKGKPTRRRVGLKVTGRGIVREEQDVYYQGAKIGETTSGTFCPYLGAALAMAILPLEVAEPGTQLEVDVRGRRVAAEVVKLPFYKREK
ncbi:MAG: glycine cleavage system aminomethyltransferase GcvT [Oscillospiraceae bacterium]|jgi:aminomethyltransferase